MASPPLCWPPDLQVAIAEPVSSAGSSREPSIEEPSGAAPANAESPAAEQSGSHEREAASRSAPSSEERVACSAQPPLVEPSHAIEQSRHTERSVAARYGSATGSEGGPRSRVVESAGSASTAFTASPEPRWRVLLSEVRGTQLEIGKLSRELDGEARLGLAGNPAAPPSAIAIAELRLGFRLPPSYRQFLAFSDGWQLFYEGAHLLGTADVGRPASLDPQTRRHGLDRDSIPCPAAPSARYVPFGADAQGQTVFAFDTHTRLADGELPVVAWIGGLGLDCRCFTGFLATVLQLCRSERATLRAREALRKAPEGAGLQTMRCVS